MIEAALAGVLREIVAMVGFVKGAKAAGATAEQALDLLRSAGEIAPVESVRELVDLLIQKPSGDPVAADESAADKSAVEAPVSDRATPGEAARLWRERYGFSNG